MQKYNMRSKLLSISVKNLGCIGQEGLQIDLDNILCVVGQNNTGKSTVLRAYELAVGTQTYSREKDYCKGSNENTTIEISVHIPKNVGNIAEKWKEKIGDYLIVKSKWEWDDHGSKTRKTYDPEKNEYSDDGNAAGLDNVFNSRLPTPFRIGALDDPKQELKSLLGLIVDPIAKNLRSKLNDDESELSKALDSFSSQAKIPVEEHKKKIKKYNDQITKSHNQIFPNLTLDLDIGIADIKIDPVEALIRGSNLRIKEFSENIDWEQQGTGSQRALFWSLLQVRSKLQSINDFKVDREKRVKVFERDIKKIEKQRDGAKTDVTKGKKQLLIDTKKDELQKLIEIEPDTVLESKEGDVSLPGYMLLIDEPEIALHPNGIRAASKYLYDLAKDDSWQIMLSTHSPLFINPFEDHTTIVRLSRNEGSPSPKTYKSDEISFNKEELDELKLLNVFDQNLAEMFFGQYPLIVEGDTEFASFERIMQMDSEKYSISLKPVIIRARGKFTITPIIRMLSHFKVNFSVLHDTDYPKNKKGNINNVWSYNYTLYDEIETARKAGLKIIHRVSMSTFEIEHQGVELNEDGDVRLPPAKDKPWIMYNLIKDDAKTKVSVERAFDDLISTDSTEEPYSKKFSEELREVFKKFVVDNKIKDLRYKID